MKNEKTVKSCYAYPLRSFQHHKSAYILLALSLLCMVILCTSVLIYYASSYEAEVETLRREVGPQHTQFYDVDPQMVSDYTKHAYIKDSLCVEVYAAAGNQDDLASFSEVYFTGYDGEIADYFSLKLEKGRLPENFGEIIVSEKALRYFSCFSLDEELPVEIMIRGHLVTVPFRVVGVFSCASSAEQYVFASPETALYLKNDDPYIQYYTVDIYLQFQGSDRTAYKASMQKLINALGMIHTESDGSTTDIFYEERNAMLSDIALLPPYYEGGTMLLMFLFSVLPAGIALAVFIYLDMQKNLGELATLTMIGATWKQIFRMQLYKYGAIFLGIFPIGVACAAGLLYLVCCLTDVISPDRVFLWFHFDFGAVIILLLLLVAILFAVVYFISKKMTAVAHADMLSAAHNQSNIFVSRTSNLLFSENRITEKLSILFFTRNRRINRLFCLVIVLLVIIYAFFSQQITNEYKEVPDKATMELVDFYIYGDEEHSFIYDTMLPETQDDLESIPHVRNVQRRMEISPFYSYIDETEIYAYIPNTKQLVVNTVKNGSFNRGMRGRVLKSGRTITKFIGADSDLLHTLVGHDVVSGSLSSLYEEKNTVALVVHGWSESFDKYYQAGDTIDLWRESTVSDSSVGDHTVKSDPISYTVGAVIYRPHDDAYDDFITVYTSPELFTEMTGIEDVYCYALQCDGDDDETLSQVRTSLEALEYEDHFRIEDVHEILQQAQNQAIHTVFYISLMQSFVLIVSILLLVAMSQFMLEVRAPAIRAMEMIGALPSQIFRINITEFLLASLLATLGGLLLAAIIGLLHLGNLRGMMILIPFLSLLLLTCVNLFTPLLICRRQLQQRTK
ncbi:MAG: hypothetical protein J6I50_04710 [Clostridia bacterium]|nr:hypothetical protein [Clostridia bacterium]